MSFQSHLKANEWAIKQLGNMDKVIERLTIATVVECCSNYMQHYMDYRLNELKEELKPKRKAKDA